MKRHLLVGAATAAALLVPAASVSAGEAPGTMIATPNPVTLGGEVTVSNTADADSTCEGNSQVWVQILDPAAAVADEFAVTPDASGNWSFIFGPDQLGAWIVTAECQSQDAFEAAFPNFPYTDHTILVQAPGTVVPTTATPTTAAPSTTATQAATVTPAFTG